MRELFERLEDGGISEPGVSDLQLETESVQLAYQDVVLRIDGAGGVLTRIGRALSFFASHFDIGPGATLSPDVLMILRHFDEYSVDSSIVKPENRITIRTGAPRPFNLWGYAQRRPDRLETVYSPETRTAIVMDRHRKRIDLYVTESSSIQLIELVRDLVIKILESRRRLMVHAAACSREGSATLLIGAKGAGKTTLLLDLVYRRGLRLVSGDKVVLSAGDGTSVAHGWPDMPHLGLGTIRQYPSLLDAIDELGLVPPSSHARDKFLIPQETFDEELRIEYARLPLPVGAILMPHITEVATPRIQRARFRADDAIRPHLELAWNDPFRQWHHFLQISSPDEMQPWIDQVSESLRDVPVFECFGPEPLDDDDFLRIFAE